MQIHRPEIHVYQLGTFNKIRRIFFLVLTIAIIFVLLFFLLQVDSDHIVLPLVFILPMVLALGVFVFITLSELTTKITITAETIHFKNLFATTQIAFRDVKGFKMIDAYTRIGMPGWEVEITSDKGTSITAHKAIENQDRLIEWLRASFRELS